ncbi:MAG: proline--tRNA ligase [Desulfonatronovibrionaceae bacterium]
MRWSRFFIPTMKEVPAEAEVISHQLLLRAGMIRKLTSGIYTYLPTGWRSLQKISTIIRQEMDRFGGIEMLMPAVQPGDLWQESGRWEAYGRELLRFKDRHSRDYCIGPTHEEVITDLIRREVRSYRQLPMNLYQIQTKFRDEIRPRFGLMRGREFIMKDAYSFDKDDEGASRSYEDMRQAYVSIFQKLGLKFRAVEADSGSIGGSVSHEFMVLADTGEDTIATCRNCDFAANLEKAEVKCEGPDCPECSLPVEKAATPGMHRVDEIADFFKIPESRIVKTLLFNADGRSVAALIRGDREINEIKLGNILNASSLRMASAEEVRQWTGAEPGFAGPVGLKVDRIIADLELQFDTDWITGANETNAHLLHIDLRRDSQVSGYYDLRTITTQDDCPRCRGKIFLTKGIEVGHIFKLGTKYSQAMNALFLDEKGQEKQLIMGCYGIGVSRILAACIEQNHDPNGIIFTPAIAPFEAVVLALNYNQEEVRQVSEKIYKYIKTLNIDVILDDRQERPGFKFKDADLAGFPLQIIVGGKGISNNVLEVKIRHSGERLEIRLDEFESRFPEIRTAVLRDFGLV